MKAEAAASLIDRLRSLAPGQRRVLERRLAEKGIDIGRLGILPRLGPRDVFPMSHTQERLWFLQQLDPESIAYHIWSFHELIGPLDWPALVAALSEMVRRHEVLHTTFTSRDDQPVQIVHSKWRLPLPRIDLSRLSPERREVEARRIRVRHREPPFDLERGPLLRLALLRFDEQDHTLIVAVHHIISDAWSIAVFQRELSALYEAWRDAPGGGVTSAPLRGDQHSPLPELPIQYGDFVHWQRTWQQPKVEEEQLAYWRRQLAGAPAVMQLPTDRPRPKIHRDHGASVQLTVPAEVTAYLKVLGRREGATLFMAMLAAFKALLLRFTGQNDLCVGMPVAGRGREEVEDLLGFFVNTLVLRTDLAGNPSYRELLRRVRQVVIAAQDHQDMAFARLVDELQPERSLTHTPLFQVSFAMLATPVYAGTGSWNRFDTARNSAFFDLDLELLERSTEELTGWLYYNTSLFDATTLLRLRRQWYYLFGGMIQEPDRGVLEHDLLAPAERWQLETEWPRIDRVRPPATSLQGLFEARAAAAPDALALISTDRHLTYGRLDRRANRLARRLRQLGVRDETRVGLCVQRSLDLVVGILGILKAGGVYVPLDPNYPRKRLALLIEDSRAALVVTHRQASERLLDAGARVLCLDAEAETIRRQSSAGLRHRTDPDNAAYVIYTSGSTGKPKGVVVTHHNVLRLFGVTEARFAFDRHDIWTLFHSYAFDFSVWELWGALLYGGRLVIVPFFVSRSPADFYRLLEEQRVSVLNQTPSAFRQLLQVEQEAPGRGTSLPALRRVIFGGEALEVRRLGSWLERSEASRPRLVNMYGITETTVHVTLHDLGLADAGDALRSPVGRALPDQTAHVLDTRGEPVPVGIAGELYVGGDGSARGYLGRPHLSAERFVPDPFSRRPGARLYRSGDQARLLPDGALDFLGRVDHQVKIRGFRIELGEIEAQLAEHPAVLDVVVLARDSDSPEAPHKRLVAYFVPASEGLPEARDLRAFLLERLPEFMVPAAFLTLEAIPITAHGKVDRGALERLDLPSSRARARSRDQTEAPRTEIEKQLAEIWCSILHLDEVGRSDNFFELGGDSILSIQIVARVNRLGMRLTPRQFFQFQTLADLAAVAGEGEAAVAEQSSVTGDLVLTPAQQWFFEQQPKDPHHYNQAVLLRLRGAPDPSGLRRACALLVSHHDALRLRFDQTPEGWRQVSPELSPDSLEVYSRVDLSELAAPAGAMEAAASRLQASLDLRQGPVFRVAHFQLAEGDERLFAVAHHLVVDGVSWRILLSDLEAAAGQFAGGEAPSLPAKTTSFQRWGERLAEHARSAAAAEEQAYWLDPRREVAAAVPADLDEAANSVASARVVRVSLDVESTQALLREVPKAYRTHIHEVLMAGLLRALTDGTESSGLLVEVEGHGREEEILRDVDLSLTVGWFTTFYPVLLERPEKPGPGELLKAVKETLRGVPRRGIGYGLLRYLAGDEALAQKLRSLPQPEVSFNYLGRLDQALPETALFAAAGESTGPAISPRQQRRYLLEINCSIFGDRLHAEWTYNHNRHRRQTVERLADGFLAALKELIQHCTSPEAGGYTPSDFPLAGLDQPTLDRLLSQRAEVADVYPLSPSQQGMLFFSLYDPTSQAYFVQSARRLYGALDVDALRQAFDQLVAQHASLRTSFAWEGLAEPLGIVHQRVEVPWVTLDWRDSSEAEQAARLERYLARDREQVFDLARAPLLRVSLIRLADESYFLNWSYHHIMADGWSVPLLRNELLERYLALCAGHQPNLPSPQPYSDYIAWLQRQDLAQAESFWRRHLAGFNQPNSIGLTPATTGAKQGEERYGARGWNLNPETFERLRGLTTEHRLTFNTLAQAAWALVLARFSGRGDVVFGATVSGRSAPLPGIDEMIGLFINTLPVRARLDPRAVFSTWAEEIQNEQVAAREYEHTPLMQIQKWSDVSASRLLFESILVFENYPLERTAPSGPAPSEASGASSDTAPLEAASTDTAPSNTAMPSAGRITAAIARSFERTSYPLTLIVIPLEAIPGIPETTWFLQLGFDLRLFEPSAGERIAATFETLLAGIAERPDARLWELPVVSDAERRQLLAAADGADAAADGTIARLFERQARATPDAVAVVFERRPAAGPPRGERLSYRQLDRQADRLAHRLRSSGIGPEDRVAVFLERCPDLIVALLGVLKAGAAYLPLDPRTPSERLVWMLADAGARLTLTYESLRSSLPPEGAVLCLDSLAWTEADPPSSSVDTGTGTASGEQLAYLIYTSGSTGRPKAVMVKNRSLAEYCLAAANGAEIGPRDRVLQFASISFDTSAEEIYPCLIRGGTLVLRDDLMLELPRFLDACRDHALTVLDLPTAYWHELTRYLDRELLELPPSVRLVILGGEKAEPEAVAVWHRNVGERVLLVNTYGPTEATIVASQEPLITAPVPRETAAGPVWLPVPIGRPRPGTRALVLDSFLRPMAPQIAGELYLGGSGLARGYDRRPALTAAAFSPDPFSTPGERLYRTGDRVRAREDWALEFLGRVDRQVKLRGFRVELGEIESVLEGHPAVAEAAVALRQNGVRQLVACTVAEGDAPASRELGAYLRTRLPDYMVPASFVELPALPRLASGKIDRRAVLELAASHAAAPAAAVAPRDDLERRLVGLFEDLFSRAPISVRDDFFELGGDSLIALRFMTLLRQELGHSVPLAALFERRTPAELADLLRQEPHGLERSEAQGLLRSEAHGLLLHSEAHGRLGDSPLVPIQASGSRVPLFFVHPAGGNVLCYRDLGRHLGPDQPFFGLQAGTKGSQGRASVPERASRYLEALRRARPEGPYALGGWSVGGVIAFEMAQQLAGAGYQVPGLVLIDTLTPKGLPEWPGGELAVPFSEALGIHQLATPALSVESFRSLDLERQLDHLLERARHAGVLPAATEGREIRRLWRIFEAVVRSVQDYVPAAYPGDVLLLRAGDDPGGAVGPDADLGWRSYVADGLEVEWSPGEHGSIVHEPYVRAAARRLTSYLTRRSGDRAPAAAGHAR